MPDYIVAFHKGQLNQQNPSLLVAQRGEHLLLEEATRQWNKHLFGLMWSPVGQVDWVLLPSLLQGLLVSLGMIHQETPGVTIIQW